MEGRRGWGGGGGGGGGGVGDQETACFVRTDSDEHQGEQQSGNAEKLVESRILAKFFWGCN